MAVVSSQVGPDEGEGDGGALQAGVGEREPRPVGDAAADADGGGLAGGEGGVPGRCAGTRREIACARAAERVVRWLPREMPVGMAAIGEAIAVAEEVAGGLVVGAGAAKLVVVTTTRRRAGMERAGERGQLGGSGQRQCGGKWGSTAAKSTEGLRLEAAGSVTKSWTKISRRYVAVFF